MDPAVAGEQVSTVNTQYGAGGVHPSRVGSPPPPPPAPDKIVIGSALADTAQFPFTLSFTSTTNPSYDHQRDMTAYWGTDLGTPQAAIYIALRPWCDETACSLDMEWIIVGTAGPNFTCSVPESFSPIVLHVIAKQGLTMYKNGFQYKLNYQTYVDKAADPDREIKSTSMWAFVWFKVHCRASTAERNAFIEAELKRVGMGMRLVERMEPLKHQVYFDYDKDLCKHSKLETLKNSDFEGTRVSFWFNPSWFEPNLGGYHCTKCYMELPRSNVCPRKCGEKKISLAGAHHTTKQTRKEHEQAAKRRKMEQQLQQQRAAGAGSSIEAIVPR